MNVSEQIINVLDNLCQKFGMAIDWSATNVLPYVKELCGRLIKWEIVNSIFCMVFWPLLTGIIWLISKPLIKKAKEDEWDFDYCGSPWTAMILIVIACICTVITVVNIGVESYDIIEAINFPEKTIYDYISNVISSNNA